MVNAVDSILNPGDILVSISVSIVVSTVINYFQIQDTELQNQAKD